MSSVDPITRLNTLRARVLAGEEITKEESAEAIRLLRADREMVLGKQVTKEAAKAPVDLESLFKPKA